MPVMMAVPVMVPVPVPVMVMIMMVMGPRAPNSAAVAMAAAPVVMAHVEPPNIVDHVAVRDSRLHRRWGDDRRKRVRRHQRGARHGDCRGSQAEKQLAHLSTSLCVQFRRARIASPTCALYAHEAVAFLSELFRCNSARWRRRGGGMAAVCNRAIHRDFLPGTRGRIGVRLVSDVLPQ